MVSCTSAHPWNVLHRSVPELLSMSEDSKIQVGDTLNPDHGVGLCLRGECISAGASSRTDIYPSRRHVQPTTTIPNACISKATPQSASPQSQQLASAALSLDYKMPIACILATCPPATTACLNSLSSEISAPRASSDDSKSDQANVTSRL